MYNEELLLTNIFIVIYELNIHHTETMKMKENRYIKQTFTELIFPKLVLVIWFIKYKGYIDKCFCWLKWAFNLFIPKGFHVSFKQLLPPKELVSKCC